VGALLAGGVDPQLDEQRPAILLGTQAAPAVRQRLRQHRHDAVGEIGAVAALPRDLVERGAGADVVGHVGDRDDQPPALAVRLGEHRVVEVAGVGPVDRHERHGAQILPPGQRCRARPLGGLHGGCGEDVRDRVRGDGNHADGAGVAHPAEPLDHPRRPRAEAALMPGQRLGEHDLAGFGARFLATRDHPHRFRPPVGRFDPVLWPTPEDAQDPPRALRQTADGGPLVAARAGRAQPRQHALAGRQRGVPARLRRHQHERRRPRLLPGQGPRQCVAIRVDAGHLYHRDLRQRPRGARLVPRGGLGPFQGA
jgi:hypothetical protein